MKYWVRIDKRMAKNEREAREAFDKYVDDSYRILGVREFDGFWRINVKKVRARKRTALAS